MESERDHAPYRSSDRFIARVRSYAGGTIAPQGGVSLNNGFDNVPQQVNSLGNNRFHYFKEKLKTYVLPVMAGSPTQVNIPPITISTQAAMVSTYGEVYTSYVYDAFPLPYPYISTDIETSSRKEGNAAAVNRRNGSMDITVDSVVQWSDHYGCWLGVTTMDGHQAVYSNPAVNWNYSGDGQLSSTTEQAFNHGVLDGFTFQVLDLANTRNATQLLGKQSQVTMAISDEDDPSEPVALTNYGIRWHFPYENWRKDPNHTPFYTWLQQPIIDVQSPGTCGYNESIGFTFTYGNPFWVTVTNSAAKAFQIVGPIAGTEFSVLGALMEVIGVVLPDFGPKALATSASFNACWNDEHSIFPDGKSEPMHRYSMAPMKFAEYKIDPWKVDLYGSHGFVQVETKATQTYVGHKSVGMFTLAVLPSEGGTE